MTKRKYAKKKEDLHKEGQEFLNEVREGLEQLKDYDFEEFKGYMIALTEQLLASQLMMLEWLDQEKGKIFDMAVDAVKQLKATNEKDFKIAERNFEEVDEALSKFGKQVSKAESTSLVALMYTCAALHAMGKRRVITNTTLNEGLKLIPKRVKRHITEALEIKPQEFDRRLAEAIEATA